MNHTVTNANNGGLSSLKSANVDAELRRLLAHQAGGDDGYWDFRYRTKRSALHGITQYPAMMVPGVQSEIIDALCYLHSGKPVVVDPFVGSGTTLVEAMRRGLPFVGQDLNPLAVLISKAKTGPFDLDLLDREYRRVMSSAKVDHADNDVSFLGLDKWFDPRVALGLAKIRRAILSVENLWVRRVLWVVVAETVRQTSNSRTSTFKLHIRAEEDLAERKVSPFQVFETVGKSALKLVREEVVALQDSGLLSNGMFRESIEIRLGDTSQRLPGDGCFDLLVASPPYGDNVSTVPYGQFSYLPLQWIDLQDIDSDIDRSFLDTTHEIDSRSLGGKRKDAVIRAEPALSESAALRKCLDDLKDQPRDRRNRVAAFAADLRESLGVIVPRMASGAHLVWTVGNRRVGGNPVPLGEILTEFLEMKGCSPAAVLNRTIPNKRMANRNSVSTTMSREQILIFRASGDQS